MHFAPNFHADDEKENSHQHLVDDEVQRTRSRIRADADRERHLPEVMIRIGQRGIGPQQRDAGSDEQHDAAHGFDVKKALESIEDFFSDALCVRQRCIYRMSIHTELHDWRPDQSNSCLTAECSVDTRGALDRTSSAHSRCTSTATAI